MKFVILILMLMTQLAYAGTAQENCEDVGGTFTEKQTEWMCRILTTTSNGCTGTDHLRTVSYAIINGLNKDCLKSPEGSFRTRASARTGGYQNGNTVCVTASIYMDLMCKWTNESEVSDN